MMDRRFTVKGLAEHLGVHEDTIRRALKDPAGVRLEHVRVRGGIRIMSEHVKAWQDRLRRKGRLNRAVANGGRPKVV